MPAFTNAAQNIPELFKVIVNNDKDIARLMRKNPVYLEEYRGLKRLKRDYIRSAEIALCWNKDKGNPA